MIAHCVGSVGHSFVYRQAPVKLQHCCEGRCAQQSAVLPGIGLPGIGQVLQAGPLGQHAGTIILYAAAGSSDCVSCNWACNISKSSLLDLFTSHMGSHLLNPHTLKQGRRPIWQGADCTCRCHGSSSVQAGVCTQTLCSSLSFCQCMPASEWLPVHALHPTPAHRWGTAPHHRHRWSR